MNEYLVGLNIVSLVVCCFSLGYSKGLRDGRPRWFNEGYGVGLDEMRTKKIGGAE